MIASIGERIIFEIIKQRMVRIAPTDPHQVRELIWVPNAVEQLEALIEEFRPSPPEPTPP